MCSDCASRLWLTGYDNFYKSRFGAYRVGLRLGTAGQTVEFMRVRHRRDIYLANTISLLGRLRQRAYTKRVKNQMGELLSFDGAFQKGLDSFHLFFNVFEFSSNTLQIGPDQMLFG